MPSVGVGLKVQLFQLWNFSRLGTLKARALDRNFDFAFLWAASALKNMLERVIIALIIAGASTFVANFDYLVFDDSSLSTTL